MLIIRPIVEHDLPALLQIADSSGIGFTSLPVNDKLLLRKIQRAQASFAAKSPLPQSLYFFVAEDSESGAIVGTTAIEAEVGLDAPFYNYHLGQVVHHSRELNVHKVVPLLTLSNDYTGCSELCSLYVDPAYRGSDAGRLLSRCRFLFMAEYRQRFAECVIAEMRGFSDEQGQSPFWQWLQLHFFDVDFPTADYLSGVGHKRFIAELMPKYPIYVSLLSDSAQQVIGKTHPATVPALKLLQKEGFVWDGYIDIFDAGPTVECRRDWIRSVRENYRCSVSVSAPTQPIQAIISNCRKGGFRALVAAVGLSHDAKHAVITADIANALHVGNGDAIRVLPLAHSSLVQGGCDENLNELSG